MAKLIIDNKTIEVPEGTSVLAAAQAADIPIPHFCWHPALGEAGACRMCAVKMVDGPVKGLQMSCMLPAQDGMVVSTTDPEAVAMRSHVTEWLMLNHPHDCPVCDEGGECLLQDFTIAGGHGLRRSTGRKRTYINQDLGPFIAQEMNRCIQCYRCVRFYQEFAGATDFGAMGSAQRIFFGRFADGQLESPFSGNLVDICPTGVFTDRTARFRARYWDYDMAPSLCPGCSLGCSITPMARYRELLKVQARVNKAVNGWFICDRGRFSAAGLVNHLKRPRTPMIEGRETTWNAALAALVRRINTVQEQYGPGSIGVVGSGRLALEAVLLLPMLAALTGRGPLCWNIDETEARRSVAALSLLSRSTSMAEVGQADCVVLLNLDLLAEGPMLALMVRQAWRRGAKIFLVGPNIRTPDAQIEAVGITCTRADRLEDLSLENFQRPVAICALSTSDPETVAALLPESAGLVCLFAGANGCGMSLVARENKAVPLARALAGGEVKALITIETELSSEERAGIPILAALDWQPGEAVTDAAIVLPTTAWVEMDGTWINFEGRAQRFRTVMKPGLPVRGADLSAHPPHTFTERPPGSELRPAWRIIADLIFRLGNGRIDQPLNGPWQSLRTLDPEAEGILIQDLLPPHPPTDPQRERQP